MESRRVAVLGGTFDPIHRAHTSVLDQVVRLLGAAEGRLVPSATPPHRGAAHAPAAVRLEMARAAAASVPGLVVDDIEIVRGGKSYTVDTVEAWAQRAPGDEIHLVLGADAARLIGKWHRSADLLATARFVIINRGGDSLDVAAARALGFSPERTRLLHVLSLPISATDVRHRLAAGEPVEDLLDPGVLDIIRREGLYGTARAAGSQTGPRAIMGPG